MRQIVLLFICFCLLKDVAAQVKPKTTKTNEKGKIVRDEPEPPPPNMELMNLKAYRKHYTMADIEAPWFFKKHPLDKKL